MDRLNIILPVIFIGWTLLSIPIVYRFLRRNRERMRSVADELGFTFHGGDDQSPGAPEQGFGRRLLQILKPWRITGSRDGVAVAIYLESRGGGKSRTTYSIVEASFPRPLPFTLRMGRETSLTRFGKAVFGIQDIEIGSDRLDAGVRIRTSDAERARRLLADAGVQERILAALQAFPTVIVTERAVIWEKRATVRNTETWRAAIEAVVPVVVALRSADAFEPS
jgi:hypothetical protein